jgi:hypothetical protein
MQSVSKRFSGLGSTQLELISKGVAILALRGWMLYFRTMKIQFTSQIFREGKMYVAYTPELDLSSCATIETKAKKNLVEAARLFLEEAEKKGSLNDILREAGFSPAMMIE